MSSVYVPGKPNPYFPIHKYHGIAIGQNLKPIDECRTQHYVGAAATVQKAIASCQLTPEHLWLTFQREAEDVIKENGVLIADDTKRNKRINAAYAKLWLADNRFQWAGLAAFASKQVGCGLLHARQVAKKSKDELTGAMYWAGSNTEMAAMSAIPTITRNGSDFMFERLGYGNKHLFLDIYPLHRFYMERGPTEFHTFLHSRRSIASRIEWKAEKELAFGFPFQEIDDGFKWIGKNALHKGVMSLALHEQINVLQSILYNDKKMQFALSANQFSWAVGFPSGTYMEIQLTQSAQCKAKNGWTQFFPRSRKARLWNPHERMKFVSEAAERFDRLLNSGQRQYIKGSLETISAGSGIV